MDESMDKRMDEPGAAGLAETRRDFAEALGALEAAVAEMAERGGDAERVEALQDRIAELEAERARLSAELEALRAAREADAAMIEDALTELRAVV